MKSSSCSHHHWGLVTSLFLLLVQPITSTEGHIVSSVSGQPDQDDIHPLDVDLVHQNGSLLRLMTGGVDLGSIKRPYPTNDESNCHVNDDRTGLVCVGLIPTSHPSSSNLPNLRYLQLINSSLDLNSIQNLFPSIHTLVLTHQTHDSLFSFHNNASVWDSVQVLNISWNGLKRAEIHQLLPLFPHLALLDLSHNHVDEVEIDLDSLRGLKWVDISGNPLNCTCPMTWLDDGQVTLLHPQQTLCASPPHQNKAKPIWKVRKLIKRVRDSCKSNCSCDIAYIWEQNQVIHSKTTVNCSGRGYLTFPDPSTLPSPTDTLDLSHNHISSLHPFIQDPGWEGLEVMNLHLDSNSLTSISILESSDWFYHTCQILTFRNNTIPLLPVYVLEHLFNENKNILQVDLSLNPYHCDCTTLSTLKIWLLKHASNIKNIEDVTCAETGGQVRYLKPEDWCTIPLRDGEEGRLMDVLDLVSIFLALLILAVVAKVYYDYRNLKHTGKLPWVATKL